MYATDYIKSRKILSPEQEGFRADRSLARAITHLQLCLEDAHRHKKDTVLCYLDFKGAFPPGDHEQLVRILTFLGLHNHHFHLLQRGHYGVYRSSRAYTPHRNPPRYATGRPPIPTPFRPHDRSPHPMAYNLTKRIRHHLMRLLTPQQMIRRRRHTRH